MCRWIFIDNHTGQLVADSASLDGFDGQPVLFAQRLDEARHATRREYFELPFSAGGNGIAGYYCFRADAELPIVQTAETVARDCEPVCFVCAVN